ncbi:MULTISPECIES: hypothetical protein [unclassified Pseudoclavibacter]|uniref:hypothetical protein n=1 Tax=unclassified Pseudoclavibacter TaxID=2615177 RepID=UPI001BAB3E28|nr:hypothetical protein [Pseudoclavibacter sp. Marseille-Q4354]MBS3179596.1 hypothetical protein [Pseudoclavibacter sp. Marseille-Q4354]
MSVVNEGLQRADASAQAAGGEGKVGLLAVLGVFVLGFLALGLGLCIDEMLRYGAGMEADSDPHSTTALHYGEAKSVADLTILFLGTTWLAYIGTAVSVASSDPRPFGRTFGMLFLLSVVAIAVPVAWPFLEHSWR